ncbi:MAG: HAMP domain-containing sensor histidine kinase [Bacteroidota bacterium]
MQLISEKDKFFSIIAHDLRSPLTTFLGFTQLLEAELDTMTLKEIQLIAKSMRSSATNLFNLLGNLLEWSRMKRGVTPFFPDTLFLLDTISGGLQTIADSALQKTIAVQYDIPGDLQVFADQFMLTSTVRNLVSNAVKFTKPGGTISISANSSTANWVTMFIKDTGIGMDQETLSKLFQLDGQINRIGTEGELSTGLGLLLCKEFVEKHGGSLWAESEEEIGSTFCFTLPFKS